MRLLINTATTFMGGGVQLAESFINECKFFSNNDYHVILGDRLQKRVNNLSFPDNFQFYNAPFRPATRVFSLSSANSFHKGIERQCNPDVIFTTSGPAYWRSKAPHLIGFNLPHYLYPESAFFDRISCRNRWEWWLKGQVIQYFSKKDAEAYVVQTDDIKNRLGDWLTNGKPIHVVSNTCSSYYSDTVVFVNKLPDRENNEFRLLTLSAYYIHKNMEIIRPVLALLSEGLKKDIRFVLTLSDDIYKSLFTEQEQKYIYNVGAVPTSECPSLYRECDAMFLPTLLECFSASYPEAMAMEKPILTSDLGFARTVCGEAALYFDPIDPSDICDKITQLYRDAKLQTKLIGLGVNRLAVFGSPQTRAKKYIDICKDMMVKKSL